MATPRCVRENSRTRKAKSVTAGVHQKLPGGAGLLGKTDRFRMISRRALHEAVPFRQGEILELQAMAVGAELLGASWRAPDRCCDSPVTFFHDIPGL